MKNLYYYKWASYRRKMLDLLQGKYKKLYKGIVLDIGGRNRGQFEKPKDKVKKWIFADINKAYNPDIILDVADMNQIDSYSIDIINAIELFEHVENIEKGLEECYRVLKNNGLLILSTPFLYYIHSDPYDYQRWTDFKWKIELEKIGFKIDKIIIMGNFFTVLGDMIKFLVGSFKTNLKRLFTLFFPILDRMVKLDSSSFVKNNKTLNRFHSGYFIIAKK